MLDVKKTLAKVLEAIKTNKDDIATINDELIVKFRSQTSIPDKSIPGSGSWVMLGSFTPPKGLWNIRATVIFPSNATGRRLVTLSQTSGAFGAALTTASQQAVNGYQTYMQVEMLAYFNGSTPVYINVSHNAGSALTVGARYTMWKLGDTYRSV